MEPIQQWLFHWSQFAHHLDRVHWWPMASKINKTLLVLPHDIRYQLGMSYLRILFGEVAKKTEGERNVKERKQEWSGQTHVTREGRKDSRMERVVGEREGEKGDGREGRRRGR